MSTSGWSVVVGLALVLTARPLARVGELSSAVLSGEPSPPLPVSAHPVLLWVLRMQGVVLVLIGLAV
ncbi:hypothetical protein [Modestobacter versicolor]|uniref:hypothetical protein n=1 Tax=Modestobacter versicolor TaxID=429133 RepID=UPI0034E0384F